MMKRSRERSEIKEKSSKKKRKDVSSSKDKSKEKKIPKASKSDQDDDLNLDREIHEISYYINNRELMLENMFESVGPKLLGSMLPPSLLNFPMDELKRYCLDALECMSLKRMKCILSDENCEEMTSSSETDEFSDEICVNKDSTAKRNADSTSSEIIQKESISIDKANVNVDLMKSDDLKLCPDDEELETLLPSLENQRNKENPPSLPKSDKIEASTSHRNTVVQAKDMEILELELRAKAIRALMKQQEHELVV